MSAEPRRFERGLGRGLAALIPPSSPGPGHVAEIPLERIRPNPQQPRHTFPASEMEELAASIREHGVLQPVLVVEVDDGYVLIAGERRLRAARALGLRSVPALVRSADDQARLELALVENLQRSDLNPVDEARAYRRLIDEFGLTQIEVAERVGRARPSVSNTLRLLEAAPEVQAAVEDGTITGGHARALAGVDGQPAQAALLGIVVARGLSVRQTEELVAGWRAGPSDVTAPSKRESDPDVQQMEARMRDALGTKVSISPGRRGGRITIMWYDADDLARLVERLSGASDDLADGHR